MYCGCIGTFLLPVNIKHLARTKMLMVITIDRHKKLSGTSESDWNGYGWNSWNESSSAFMKKQGQDARRYKRPTWVVSPLSVECTILNHSLTDGEKSVRACESIEIMTLGHDFLCPIPTGSMKCSTHQRSTSVRSDKCWRKGVQGGTRKTVPLIIKTIAN